MTAKNSGQKNDKRPIVCGTDFSTTAAEAVEVAAALARRWETKLLLVHVNEVQGSEFDPGLFEAALSQKRNELDGEVARLRKAGIEAEHKLSSGSVFDELVNAAIDAKGRLLMVGAVGHGLSRRLLVGSVAERSAETSPIPTLVVRPGSRLASWAGGEHPLKVLVGYDFSAASDAALRFVNEMQAIGECQTSIVHVDWPPGEAQRLGYHGPLPLTENPESMQNFLERDLANRVEMLLPREKVAITVAPGWGRLDAYLLELVNREQFDLIVIGTHRRHGLEWLRFGSVSRSILRHANIPVVVVPPPGTQKPAKIPELDRVLVATDFSDLGNNAVPYACAILRRGGTLKLFHVIEPSAASAAEKLAPHPRKENPKLRAELRSLVPSDCAARIEIEQEINESSNAAEAIAQAAERFNADVICLGSHGRGGLAKALLGSVAQGVISQSRRPVLMVRSREG